MHRSVVPVIAGLIVLVVAAEAAAIPLKINYQGKIVDGSGTPLGGTHDAVFRLYDAPVSGTMLWSDSATVASDADGIFSVVLGGDHPMVTGLGDACWLEIEIDGEILVPRREMVSVPYALRAAAADSLDGLTAEAFAVADHTHDERYSAKTQLETPGSINQTGNPVDWTKLKGVPAGFADGVDDVGAGDGSSLDAADGNPTDVVYVDNDGRVGVGTKTPAVDLDVVGTLRITSDATTPFEVKGTGSTYAKVEAGTGASAGIVLRNSSREWDLVGSGGGQDNLSFYDATSLKHRLTIDGPSGKIGIGKTNPSSELHIYKYANDEASIRIDNPHTGPLSTEALYFADENAASAGLAAYDDDHGFGEALRLFNVRPHGYIALFTAGHISMSSGGSEQVRLDSGGNLGIGTTDPKARLEVNGLARIVGTGGFAWPSSGEGIELAYNPGMNRGYLQVYDRSTPGWGDLYLGDAKIGIGGGSLDKNGRLNVQTTGTSCIMAENTGGGCSAEIAGSSGYGLTAKSQTEALFAWNTSSNCTAYLGGSNYALLATGSENHVYLGYGAWAGDFSGNIYVAGSVYKAGGGFRIDHPLDPENKYLNHSFVESPDMMDIYNGNVVLDDGGEAWVEMPQWFEALNRDCRYQLTCIGRFAPVYVAEKMDGNRFKIAGGEPGLEVSWQVTGIRHDPYADKHRVPVEEAKAPGERGKYLRPDDYGKPASAGIDYVPQPGQGE
jgi:hypothetical protein